MKIRTSNITIGMTLSRVLAGSALCGLASLVWIPMDLALAQQIQVEQANIAERAFFHYHDPEVALRSYAAVDTGGCSGMMIGPNTLLTAAHCSGFPKDVTFHTYTSAGQQVVETFKAQYLMHTYKDTDLILFYLFPNDAGENAGDKYGYVDFDLRFDSDGQLDISGSRNRVEEGAEVYAFVAEPNR